MKILQIIPVLSPDYGGPITVLYQLTAGLSRGNNSVTILTSDLGFDKNLAKKFEDAGVTIIPVHTVFNIGLFIYTPSVKKWIIKNLRSFDIIHMHVFRSYQNNILRKYAVQYGIPYIIQAHGSVLPFFEKTNLKRLYDLVWGRSILKDACVCIALTKTESDQYIKRGVPENKVIIIPNGIDLSRYANLPSRGQFRLKNQIPGHERVILSLGRIHKIKGVDVLVTAFSRLRGQMADVKLVIAGPDGGSLSRIRDQVHELQLEKEVILTGSLDGNDKLEAYVDADVFVLPSRYETFPITILEAWACGTPVIATIYCGISDIIRTVDEDAVIELDSARMTDKIQDLLNDEVKRKMIGMKGKKIVEDNFNMTGIIQKVEEIYRGTREIMVTIHPGSGWDNTGGSIHDRLAGYPELYFYKIMNPLSRSR